MASVRLAGLAAAIGTSLLALALIGYDLADSTIDLLPLDGALLAAVVIAWNGVQSRRNRDKLARQLREIEVDCVLDAIEDATAGGNEWSRT